VRKKLSPTKAAYFQQQALLRTLDDPDRYIEELERLLYIYGYLAPQVSTDGTITYVPKGDITVH